LGLLFSFLLLDWCGDATGSVDSFFNGEGQARGLEWEKAGGKFKFQMALLTSCVFRRAMERGERRIALRRRR